MAKKRITTRPPEEVEIIFNDYTYIATFNLEATSYTQELMGENEGFTSHVRTAAYIIYGAIVVNHKEFTIEEAIALIKAISQESVNEIIEEFYKAAGVNKEKIESIQEEYIKKQTARFVSGKSKS